MRFAVYTALLVSGLVAASAPTMHGNESSPPSDAARPADSRTTLDVERVCSPVTQPGRMACMALRVGPTADGYSGKAGAGGTGPGNAGAAQPATPDGYGPADLQSAYGIPAGGDGVTIAITDAYDDPRAESDLGVYRSNFGLAACTTANGCFRKVNQNGGSSPLPSANSGWSGEISLDLDMVSAICPSCHILLVEASSNNDSDLFRAINRAVSMGAKFVNNSWGDYESASQIAIDSQYLNHPGVVITASTGDDGYGTAFPASSQYVTAVGGTSLSRASNARGWSETAWAEAGSGCSAYEPRPAWQSVTTGCDRRAEADVSAVADPGTGVAVYQTYGGGGWSVYGGTSAASPIIAAVYALAGTPGAGDYPASYPYAHAASLFDVVSGDNGSCGSVLCRAGIGWDGPTGLGTPNGVGAFSAGGAAPTPAPSPTPTPTPTPTRTPPSPTPTPTPACPVVNAVRDGGFEGSSGPPWIVAPGVIVSQTPFLPAHIGTHLARFDGFGRLHTDTMSQLVTVPSGCGGATLTYWVRVMTAEITGSVAYDTLKFSVNGATLATTSNLDHGGYALVSVDMSAYMGQSVTITFTGAEDRSLATVFSVDDVGLTGTDGVGGNQSGAVRVPLS